MSRLKSLRVSAGMTQDELSKASGMAKNHISDLERGVRDLARVRVDTIDRLCAALGCTQDELLASEIELQYEDDKLIVDGLYSDTGSSFPIVEIDGEYFMVVSTTAECRAPKKENLNPYKRGLSANAIEMTYLTYLLYGLVPRGGFKVEVKRAITPAELKKFCGMYNISESDKTGEFTDTIGNIFGKKYAKEYTAIQVKVDAAKGVEAETYLKNIGIQASNGSAGRINIRIR